ncbi:MAG: glycosyltransferase family 2 protein [Candidatus Eremiobacteraeota bacterium]|nr:glycosyltransferase family 2 protein [Candidatus Eremiobacteraeota bacterium]
MKLISVFTPCYNEQDNVESIYRTVKEIFQSMPQYRYEHVFIDNASRDRTVEILKDLARNDRSVKVIVNTRNFGHIRSPYHGLLQCSGDAVIYMVADFQDPPELMPEFLKKWEEGARIVIGVKEKSKESPVMFAVRRLYYSLIGKLSEIELIKNFSTYALYDKEVLEVLKKINDPFPYLRGLICDLGFSRAEVKYTQNRRERGITSNNFYTLYDNAMLGITNHSKVPLRIATFSGFVLSIVCLLAGLGYLVYKLIRWNDFQLGLAPMIIGLFLFSSMQLFFTGILGEYIGAIHTQVLKRPLVIEKERINFDSDPE